MLCQIKMIYKVVLLLLLWNCNITVAIDITIAITTTVAIKTTIKQGVLVLDEAIMHLPGDTCKDCGIWTTYFGLGGTKIWLQICVRIISSKYSVVYCQDNQ